MTNVAPMMDRVLLCVVALGATICVGATVATAQSEGAVLDWKDTVDLEHEDRKKRLQKLSEKSFIASPKFYDYLVSSSALPQFGIDVPVLRVVYEDKIFFDTDSSDLLPNALAVVSSISQSLRNDAPDLALFVAGHADSRASKAYNYSLSVRRSQSVVAALHAQGVGATNMWSIGFGENVPIRRNDSEKNMAVNRRVEFLFASRAEAIAKVLADPMAFCSDDGINTSAEYCPVSIEATEYQVALPAEETIKKADLEENFEKTSFDEKQVEAQIEEHREEAEASEPVEKAEIQPNSRVYIDLKESTIKVGAPQL